MQTLVTGGSGFVAGHVIQQLLQAGHAVRTTVRDLKREPEVRKTLGALGNEKLSFAAADLTRDDGWRAAVNGCEFVHHVASPFPLDDPKDENELIIPAREGALRVLRAAKAAGVKRVVQTSSFAAIGYGHPRRTKPFDENDWTDITNPRVPAYHKSKTLAERAAWDFVANEGRGLELAVINPTGIYGPALSKDLSSSVGIIQTMLSGGLPVCPNLSFGIVDVRDVAKLHLAAMTHPEANGQRFIAVAETMSLPQIAQLLKDHLGTDAAKVSTRSFPYGVMWLLGRFNRQARKILPDLGLVRPITNAKARRVFQWTPIPAPEAVLASARSLLAMSSVRGSHSQ